MLALLAGLAAVAAPAAEQQGGEAAPAKAPAAEPMQSDPALLGDLVQALTLQGIDCDEATGARGNDADGYEVDCGDDGLFQLKPDGEGGVAIFSLLGDVARVGVGGVRKVLAVPGRVLGFSRDTVAQSSEIARHLFGIVRLAGRDCAEVVEVERRADDDHVVRCSDGSAHHVYTGSDGLVVVEDPGYSEPGKEEMP